MKKGCMNGVTCVVLLSHVFPTQFIFPATVGRAALCGANRGRGGCSPKGSELVYAQWVARGLACYFTAEFATVFLNSAARRKRLYV